MAVSSMFRPGAAESVWRARVLRARELAQEHAAHRAALLFYEKVLAFQAEVARACRTNSAKGVPLRAQIDSGFVTSSLPRLFALTSKEGTAFLRAAANELENAGPARWKAVIEAGLSAGDSGLTDSEVFFSRACLQPVAEVLRMQLSPSATQMDSTCPVCGGLPQMAVLHPEGEGSSRWLLCSFCLGEWPFRRIICPWCSEENKEELPRYSAEECAYVHVEACETCKRYIKAVDMSVNGLAVPVVDEAALAVLDVWAGDRRYTKIVRNLLGF